MTKYTLSNNWYKRYIQKTLIGVLLYSLASMGMINWLVYRQSQVKSFEMEIYIVYLTLALVGVGLLYLVYALMLGIKGYKLGRSTSDYHVRLEKMESKESKEKEDFIIVESPMTRKHISYPTKSISSIKSIRTKKETVVILSFKTSLWKRVLNLGATIKEKIPVMTHEATSFMEDLKKATNK